MENPSLHKFFKAFKKTGCFFLHSSYVFIFLSWKIFFILHLKTFQYEKLYLWVNVWLFYHARSLAHGMLQRNSLTYSKKIIYIYILTHLLGVWNRSNIFIPVLFPFTLTLLRMKNTIIPLYCAAFIVDCFMSVRIHFLLNLSSFTQGHIPLCISIPQLFKTWTCLS